MYKICSYLCTTCDATGTGFISLLAAAVECHHRYEWVVFYDGTITPFGKIPERRRRLSRRDRIAPLLHCTSASSLAADHSKLLGDSYQLIGIPSRRGRTGDRPNTHSKHQRGKGGDAGFVLFPNAPRPRTRTITDHSIWHGLFFVAVYLLLQDARRAEGHTQMVMPRQTRVV